MKDGPAFQTYGEFLEYYSENRGKGLILLGHIGRYAPFVFGNLSDKEGMITICAGYKIISDLSKILKPRVTSEYKAWRKNILNRDDYKYTKCGSEEALHAHHIDRVVDNPDKIINFDNGITLCNRCHRKVHKGILNE